ncbi:MAG TPA: acetyltransferase [Noviherbaspirillum sp.]|nr:acetyltransferase [Noviherbaspirillum sp.]
MQVGEPQAMSICAAGPADFERLTVLWEASVRATHHFLTDDYLALLRDKVRNEYLAAVELRTCRNDAGDILGFIGVSGRKVEMLFVDPQRRGEGIGRRLMEYAVREMGATEVDVNEQNPAAAGFYRHLGFEPVGRSPLDGLGRPYPVLHLRLVH